LSANCGARSLAGCLRHLVEILTPRDELVAPCRAASVIARRGATLGDDLEETTGLLFLFKSILRADMNTKPFCSAERMARVMAGLTGAASHNCVQVQPWHGRRGPTRPTGIITTD
jgi:hypothetical protein